MNAHNKRFVLSSFLYNFVSSYVYAVLGLLCLGVSAFFSFFLGLFGLLGSLLSGTSLLRLLILPLFFVSLPFRLSFTLLLNFYNALMFSFLFLTSQLLVLFDAAIFIGRSMVGPIAYYTGLRWFSFLRSTPFALTRPILFALKAFYYSFVLTFSFVILFSEAPFFSSYLTYDLGRDQVDAITHGLAGVWYSSDWWYFRIWFLYIFVYVLLPSSRILINENAYFIFWFPLFLKVIDSWGAGYIIRWMDFDLVEILGGAAFFQAFVTVNEYTSVFFPQAKERVAVDDFDEYSVPGFSGQEFVEYYNESPRVRTNYTKTYSFFGENNPESGHLASHNFFHSLNVLHRKLSRGMWVPVRRAILVPYLYDIGELSFKTDDLVDVLFDSEVYFSEDYYMRSLNGSDQSALVPKLTKVRYFPIQ